jgi:hypothetical protein
MRAALFSVREWFAENFSGAQYPKQQLLPRQPAPPFFKHQMPFWKRYLLLLIGLIALGVAALLAFAIGMIVWAAFTA